MIHLRNLESCHLLTKVTKRETDYAFSLKKFENLKHFSIKSSAISSHIGSLLYNLTTITETVEDLTVDSQGALGLGNENFRFTLEKLFTVFPKVTCLCIKSSAWWELDDCLISEISSKAHYGGSFTPKPGTEYVLGTNLDYGLLQIGSYANVLELLKYVSNHKVIDVYIEHDTTTLSTYFNRPKSEVIIEELDDNTPLKDASCQYEERVRIGDVEPS
ncbi:hypothetical protein Tco_0091811 [Tanacetum coccineum]